MAKNAPGTRKAKDVYSPSPLSRMIVAGTNPSSRGAPVRGSTGQPVGDMRKGNPCAPKKGGY